MSDGSDEVETYYPSPCAFCHIASNYPPSTQSNASASRHDAVPTETDANSQKIQPACFLILNSPDVMAFLDIMPITRGHVLVVTRAHRRRIAEVEGEESREVGFWLPIVSRAVTKALKVTDYNIVQNNGLRAAQIVPHVHFHIIPRPDPAANTRGQSRNWIMFGRGMREDLDEEEAEELAREMRELLREEIKRIGERGNL